jgi:transcription elongation factor GreB
MSRAFVNEDNAAAAGRSAGRAAESARSPITSRRTGLAQLQAKVAELQSPCTANNQAKGEQADKQRLADLERDLRYFNQRVAQRPGRDGRQLHRDKGADRQPGDVRR